MGRPKGSTSTLAARASRRNLLRGAERARKRGEKSDTTRRATKWELMADRREEARLAREEAQAIREQARARLEAGELCQRSEAVAEVTRMARLVRAELDRVLAYLEPGLAPEVRAPCEAALGTAVKKLRHALAGQVEGGARG